MINYSIVIPCYKSSDTIAKVVDLTRAELLAYEIEFILVNDGSPDGGLTAKAIEDLSSKYADVTSIDLAKNTGQHNAILCGLSYAEGEYIICMDDDMQTHPSQIHKLIDKINEGFDVVYARYPNKKHSLFRRMGSSFNSFCEKIFIGKPSDLQTNSYWIMKSFVKDYLILYKDSHTYLDGLVMRTTDNIANVDVEHFERESGTSGYTLSKLIKHWFDIIGFTTLPLKVSFTLGTLIAIGAIIGVIVILIKKLFYGVSSTGWSSVMVAIFFFSGVILMFLGIIGEYIGRLFLTNSAHPQHVIRKIQGKDIKKDL